MKYIITTIPNFDKQFKRLEKKYPSLFDDITTLAESLSNNPTQGTSLGNGLYKLRLNISSKKQGKSGGARVITCVKIVGSMVVLAAMYDKSEQGTMTTKEIKKLLQLIP